MATIVLSPLGWCDAFTLGLAAYTLVLSITQKALVGMSAQEATVLFADVAGSSGLYKVVGDNKARALVALAVERMVEAVAAHGGTLVKTIGDEVMAHFPSAAQGVAAAISMQQDAETLIEGHTMALRIGLNAGSVLLEAGDVFGEAVNDAAALVKIARRRQIVTNADTVKQLPTSMQTACKVFDRVVLKGGHEEEDIVLVRWETPSTLDIPTNATVITTLSFDQRLLLRTLKLFYQQQSYELKLDTPPLHIGRDRQLCALPVDSNMASRDHLHIEFRRGKFVLVDHSTNGTYVRIDGAEELFLRREELPLTGDGTISVGRPVGVEPGLEIRFVF